jgi:hypothetical protein
MSRSQPQLTNPAGRFFTWSGSHGQLEWYDKENQKNVPVKLPFTFLVADQLSTITGYSDADESGFWSNEVRSIRNEELTVRTKKGTRYVGLYKNDQGIVQLPTGARYAKSIYIAYYDENGELQLGNIKASGVALTAFIELTGKHIVENGKCAITGSTEGKKGTTVYQIPTFEWSNSTAEEDEIAVTLDKELQVYLSQYLAAAQYNRSSQEEVTTENVTETSHEVAKKNWDLETDIHEDLARGLAADGISKDELNDLFPE